MSERFTPYEPSEAKEPPQEPKPLSSEAKASLQGGPEATKPGDLNHPMEGSGEWRAYGDGRGGLVTPEMTEKHGSPENQIEREPYTYRAVPTDTTPPATGPADTPVPQPAGDTPPPNDDPPPGPPLSKEDQATLDWLKRERERQEQEMQADLKRWDERPKPAYYRGPDDPPLNPPHFERRPPDQINDVARPTSETPLTDRGRRSIQGPAEDDN